MTVAVVEWTTPFRRKRRGLCSSWLASIDPKNGKVFLPVWFTKGAISLPSPSVPLILVGPGTGCAPFRSFIQERIALSNSGEVVAPILFFFGCRNKSKDFLYEADWKAWSEGQNVLSVEVGGDVFVAFSRDQPEKVYVQHKILEQVPPSTDFSYPCVGVICFLSYFDGLRRLTESLLDRFVMEHMDFSLHLFQFHSFLLLGNRWIAVNSFTIAV